MQLSTFFEKWNTHRIIGQNARLPQTYNGYLQLVSTTLSSGTNKLTGYMTVPPNPTSQSGQTLYFFPGLQDAQNVVTILQPVLGWDAYGANNWTIASWNCCKSARPMSVIVWWSSRVI